jgi:hypothetical protein
MKTKSIAGLWFVVALSLSCPALWAADQNPQNILCKDLPTHAELQAALKAVVDVGGTNNAGFGLNMWATTVNRD